MSLMQRLPLGRCRGTIDVLSFPPLFSPLLFATALHITPHNPMQPPPKSSSRTLMPSGTMASHRSCASTLTASTSIPPRVSCGGSVGSASSPHSTRSSRPPSPRTRSPVSIASTTTSSWSAIPSGAHPVPLLSSRVE